MGVSGKKFVEVGCRLNPGFAVFAPFALGFGSEDFDDVAGVDRAVIHSGGADLISNGLAGAELIEGDVLVFVLALDGGDVMVGGGEAGVGVLEVAEIIVLCF